jgi:hypothetical protein
MKLRTMVPVIIVAMIAVFSLTSCSAVGIRYPACAKQGYGPPPHAPAHGYRHKHRHGGELVYDSGLGVYVVIDLADHYYYDNHYYRYHQGGWQVSVRMSGPWDWVEVRTLPPGLQKKTKVKKKIKKRAAHGVGVIHKSR